MCLFSAQSLLEIGYQIVDMLGAYRQANGAGIDMLFGLLLGRELRVGRRGRVYHEALDVGHVGQKREDFERVDESLCLGDATLDLEGEYRPGSVGEILIVERVVGMVGERGMVHLGHLGVRGQIPDYLLGVLDMALHAQRQGLEALQQQEGVEGADGRAGVAQYHGPDTCHECRVARHVGEYRAVIVGVGLGYLRELARGAMCRVRR